MRACVNWCVFVLDFDHTNATTLHHGATSLYRTLPRPFPVRDLFGNSTQKSPAIAILDLPSSPPLSGLPSHTRSNRVHTTTPRALQSPRQHAHTATRTCPNSLHSLADDIIIVAILPYQDWSGSPLCVGFPFLESRNQKSAPATIDTFPPKHAQIPRFASTLPNSPCKSNPPCPLSDNVPVFIALFVPSTRPRRIPFSIQSSKVTPSLADRPDLPTASARSISHPPFLFLTEDRPRRNTSSRPSCATVIVLVLPTIPTQPYDASPLSHPTVETVVRKSRANHPTVTGRFRDPFSGTIPPAQLTP